MKVRRLFSALLLALFGLQTLHITALADEGMWPFNNVPRAEIKKKYGFEVTDEWLNKVRLGSVRFNNGGSRVWAYAWFGTPAGHGSQGQRCSRYHVRKGHFG